MVESSWPPKSPHEALLSSPSGRQKFQQYQERRERSASPIKRSATTPNLQSIGLLEDGGVEEGEEEDEETLQLKLAAIQAKLKLKKLQQNKAKSSYPSPDGCAEEPIRPPSAASADSTTRSASRLLYRRDRQTEDARPQSSLQVPLSPTRKQQAPPDPRSPGRILLGIDKGVRGSDVSLRRAPSSTSRNSGTPDIGAQQQLRSSQSSRYDSIRSTGSSASHGLTRVKSFSERISESRQDERVRTARAEELRRKRSSGFRLNAAEMESFRAAALEAQRHERLRSPTKSSHEEGRNLSRTDIVKAYDGGGDGHLKRSNAAPSLRHRDKEVEPSIQRPNKASEPTSGVNVQVKANGRTYSDDRSITMEDPAFYEQFSRIHLSKRILPHTFLERQFEGKTQLRIPYLLEHVVAPSWELPDSDGDFVVFGIVASKSPPKDRKTKHKPSSGSDDWQRKWETGDCNDAKFMVITLTDLRWTLELYLFDTAFTHYHRLSEGTLIAILNPSLMPPPPGKADTNRFSLALNSSDETVLEIGKARDLGFCKAIKKDGSECMSWVDSTKTEFCDWHVDVQVRKTQAGRMGVNSGTALFGPGGAQGSRFGSFGRSRSLKKHGVGGEPEGFQGSGLKKEGRQYDRWMKTDYFVAPAGPSSMNALRSVAKSGGTVGLLDDEDDPFLHPDILGTRGVNKAARLQKHLAVQENERKIARELGKGAAGLGGTGAEYLRQREVQQEGSARKPSDESSIGRPPVGANGTFASRALMNKATIGRNTEGVKLSPIKKRVMAGQTGERKKTRFVTEKGIREAGRESLGTNQRPLTENDDDDDGLDIV